MHRLNRLAGSAAVLVLTAFGSDSGPAPAPNLRVPDWRGRVELSRFVSPPLGAVGLIVKARINGGPALRLLLDSGAQYLVLDRTSAGKSGCAGGSDLDLVGAGAPTPAVAKLRRVDTIEVGGLSMHNLPVVVANKTLADGVQGALPLSIFSDFLIRLDIPHKSLELTPYPPRGSRDPGSLPVVLNNRLLFVKGTVNEDHEGLFLFDTGASYSAISRKLARQLKFSEVMAPTVPLEGGTTRLDAPLLNGLVRVRIGTRELQTDSVVAVDLSASSEHHHLDIAGLIGYPALARSVVTISYRDGFIRIESQ